MEANLRLDHFTSFGFSGWYEELLPGLSGVGSLFLFFFMLHFFFIAQDCSATKHRVSPFPIFSPFCTPSNRMTGPSYVQVLTQHLRDIFTIGDVIFHTSFLSFLSLLSISTIYTQIEEHLSLP
ncbi:hypothetical protein V8F06_000605 [Rhypophila decipiens]